MTDKRVRFDWRFVIVGALVLGPMSCLVRNQQPRTPAAPAGPSTGMTGPQYAFESIAVDPDADIVAYRFAWGDGDTSDWIGASGTQGGAYTHAWPAPGTYTLRAQAKDYSGLVSSWSDGHTFSVAAVTAWTFGGDGGEYGGSVEQTPDGGYIILGGIRDTSYSNDVWLIKTDALGNKVWERTLGGTNGNGGMSIRQTADGGFIFTGYTGETGADDADAWLVKTDASGVKLWERTYGGVNGDGGSDVRPTSDGGYIVAGYTNSKGNPPGRDAWLVKIDASGNREWDKTFSGAGFQSGTSVQQTADGGYVFTGSRCLSTSDYSDVWLVKTDTSGNKEWDKTFGGTAEDYSTTVLQATDGGYVIVGNTRSYGAGDVDIWLIRTDSSGNMVWNRTFGGAGWDEGSEIRQTSDGGYIITGFTMSYGAGARDVWLLKTDASGNAIWDKTFGGYSSDGGTSVKQTSDGGYVIVGYTSSYSKVESDVWLIKTDADGR